MFRRTAYFVAYGEGWGLYSEWLGKEMGIYETPYEDFGRLTYAMWRACRLVIDTGVHHKGWTREQALAYLLDHLDTLGAPVAQVVVRPHPAEDPANYDDVIKKYPHTVHLSQGHDLFDDIAASDWVVGCNTMAMVVGLIAGRQVLCCIPPGGRPCMLPQPQIVHLQVLAAARAP